MAKRVEDDANLNVKATGKSRTSGKIQRIDIIVHFSDMLSSRIPLLILFDVNVFGGRLLFRPI